MTTLKQLCFILLFLNATSVCGQAGSSLFDNSYLHEVRIYFYEENFWDSLVHNYDENIDDSGVEVPYLKAYAQIDGEWLDTLGIRQKGLSSHYSSSEKKKPFKLDMNEYISGQKYDGIKKINLHNGACDPAMMRNFVGYNVLRTAGVPAPRMSWCKLYLNDEYWGLYELVEQLDKTFIENNFTLDSGTLIKNIGWSKMEWLGPAIDTYLVDFQLKTNELEYDWTSFLNLLDVINNSSDSEFPAAIQEVFDVDGFLHVLAADIMLNNWDSYIDNGRNWYLYEDPSDDKFHWIPWDYNLALGGDFPTGGNPYPPFDTACYLQATFSQVQNGNVLNFYDETFPFATSWHWDFGDGTTSVDKNPVHEYSTLDKFNVCLTTTRDNGAEVCESTRCKEISLGFNPQSCNTIINGSCPYPPTDLVFQQVVALDDFCCYDTWDALCQVQYQEIVAQIASPNNEGVEYELDFPLLLDDSSKVLVRRLMNVPEFRNRYFDISCQMLENNFNAERLFPLIDAQVQQIRDAIYDDPNYIFTTDYFEYDAGNGTGGGGNAKIPSLKWVLNQRFEEVAEDLVLENHECEGAFSPLSWRDVVVNEFVASNDSTSGISDPAGQFNDWIELYNNTSEVVDLSSFYLTDDPANPFKWRFPAGTFIQPNDYLIAWADNDETQPGLHTNFKLSKSGEYLHMMHEDGTMIDSLTFGDQTTNVASARMPNGTGNFLLQNPTFSQNNEFINAVSQVSTEETLRIYPNPTSDVFFATWSGTPPISISLYNALGQQMLNLSHPVGTQAELPVLHLQAGYYFIEIQLESGGRRTEKALIHRP